MMTTQLNIDLEQGFTTLQQSQSQFKDLPVSYHIDISLTDILTD